MNDLLQLAREIGFTSRSLGGSSRTTALMLAIAESRAKGLTPVSIS
jgi:hypothetical protein